MYLSKTKYVRALQCPKMLWMDTYKENEAEENPSLNAVFDTGHKVGELATHLFHNCVTVENSDNKSLMIEETKKLMEAGVENIAEASFSFDKLFCSVDILHKVSNGWEIYEVKSSNHCKTVFDEDMAFQYYVLRNCGLNITGVYNIHINGAYVRHGVLDLNQLFTIENRTETVLNKQGTVRSNIDDIRKYMAIADDFEPECEIGPHCSTPYDCAYWKYCTRNLPSPNIFDICGRFGKKKPFDYYYEGVISYEDVLKHAKLSDTQKRQVEFSYYHKPPYVDKAALKNYLDELTYPLYYLDFETFTQAIPEYDGIIPQSTKITFQYSLHIQKEKGGTIEHREFLGKEGTDPRRAVAERLCKDIPDDVCVLAYWMSFEKSRIKELADLFPDLAPHLMKIHDNIRDLIDPFKKGWYYCEAQHGSNSIKDVLPALCPNDPELDYHNLDQIHNGSEASTIFAELHTKSPEEIAQTRKNLLAYCRLDTLAMVKVLEKLYEVTE